MSALPQIPLFKVSMAPEAAERVGETLLSGYVTQGPRVEELEERVARMPNAISARARRTPFRMVVGRTLGFSTRRETWWLDARMVPRYEPG